MQAGLASLCLAGESWLPPALLSSPASFSSVDLKQRVWLFRPHQTQVCPSIKTVRLMTFLVTLKEQQSYGPFGEKNEFRFLNQKAQSCEQSKLLPVLALDFSSQVGPPWWRTRGQTGGLWSTPLLPLQPFPSHRFCPLPRVWPWAWGQVAGVHSAVLFKEILQDAPTLMTFL